MSEISRIKRRQLYTGWIKYTAIPVIFFSMFYFDAWINVQEQVKDYEIGQLYDESRMLENRLVGLTSRLAQLTNIDRLTSEAQRMGLTDPDMHQYHTVTYREIQKRLPVTHANQFETAQAAPKTITLTLSKGPSPQIPKNLPSSPVEAPPEAKESLEQGMLLTPLMETYEITVPADAGISPIAAEQGAAPIEKDPDLALLTVEDMMTSL